MITRRILCCVGFAFFSFIAQAQHRVYGTVTNQEGEHLVGVKVRVLDTYLGTYTNEDGYYELKNLKTGSIVLQFSFAGFETQQTKIEVKETVVHEVSMVQTLQLLDEMLVRVVVADEKTPTTYSNLKKPEIEKQNFGQDLPYLLQLTPSTVVTSDAGAGIGYTGIRIRGTDPTRTNVTVNGIPLNDSESHGVFWVNMPDFASSVDEIQVQRGVGTSANGSAAFGASININTNSIKTEPYAVLDNAYGSFNTWRNTLAVGTGLLHDQFTFDLRLSNIVSDGYIDRAFSDLKSLYLSGTWLGKSSQLKFNAFSGKEKTYQAWWGTPESIIHSDEQEILTYADRNYIFGEDRENLLNSGRTYNYYRYENEVDNYQQDHYHLHFNHRFNKGLQVNVSGHYTRGRGYYEQYRQGDSFSIYGLDTLFISSDTITTGDFIRRRWLDNHFYGGIFSLNYKKGPWDVWFGGGANEYAGTHYGEVIWASFASNSAIRDRYYENNASKFEAQSYLKGTYQKHKFTYYVDVQCRHIDYNFLGLDEVNGVIESLDQTVSFDFLNPKAGLMFDLNNKNNFYFSVARANREPVRGDFVESTPTSRPKHETLTDYELGYRYKGKGLVLNLNGFYMDYLNQLILTGAINDVGAYLRTNVDRSYRAGMELEWNLAVIKNFNVFGNFTYSLNKVIAFTEYVDNYDNYDEAGNMIQDQIEHKNTDLSFSPGLIGALGLAYRPFKGFEVQLTAKYVGEQYLDNTASDDRKIDDYKTVNATVSYTAHSKVFKEITLSVLVNNLLNEAYENNGYSWGYIAGGVRTVENFYYPQAGTNFLARVLFKF